MPSLMIDNVLEIMLAGTLSDSEKADRRGRQSAWKASAAQVRPAAASAPAVAALIRTQLACFTDVGHSASIRST